MWCTAAPRHGLSGLYLQQATWMHVTRWQSPLSNVKQTVLRWACFSKRSGELLEICYLKLFLYFFYPWRIRAAIAQSVQRLATGWTIGVLEFYSRRGLGIFLFTTASRTALGPTQPPIQWVPGTLSLRVKRQGREADHSPPSSAEVKNVWSYTSTPPIRLHGVVLS
jgi:hypothetical protein